MKLRTTFLTVLIFLALVIGSTVQAQDFDPCFGLSADDCAVINEASANGMGDAESFTMDVSVEFSATGLESIFALAASAASDPSMAEDAISEITFSFDGSFDFAMDEDSELGVYMNGSMTIGYSQDGGDVTEQSADVMIVSDILYINDGSAWMSIDLIRLMESEALSEQFGIDLGDVEAEDGEMAVEDLGIDPNSLGALLAVLNLPGFLSYERDGDDFIFNIDFSALQALIAEENAELLEEITASAAEIDPSLQLFVPLIPILISSGNITITQTVDTDANMITNIAVDSDLELALGMLDGSGNVTNTSLQVNFGLSNLDGVEMLDAPADATDITDLVLSMAASSMGQSEDE